MSTVSRPITPYLNLDDPHTQHFFTRSHVQKHLRLAGLLNKNGEIVTQAEYDNAQKDVAIGRENKKKLDEAIVEVLNEMTREHWGYARNHMEHVKKDLINQFRRIELQYRRRIQPIVIRHTHDGRIRIESNEPKQTTRHTISANASRVRNSAASVVVSRSPSPRSQSPEKSEIRQPSYNLTTVRYELNDIKDKLVKFDQQFNRLESQYKSTISTPTSLNNTQRFARLVERTYNNNNLRSNQQHVTKLDSHVVDHSQQSQNLILNESALNDPQTFMPYTEFLPTFDMFTKKNWI
ncbi:hypothetical protein I4U23_028697 [Adineta vaga]|nr:hypothetical protein I4U23_028697 [Adineta vaga]